MYDPVPLTAQAPDRPRAVRSEEADSIFGDLSAVGVTQRNLPSSGRAGLAAGGSCQISPAPPHSFVIRHREPTSWASAWRSSPRPASPRQLVLVARHGLWRHHGTDVDDAPLAPGQGLAAQNGFSAICRDCSLVLTTRTTCSSLHAQPVIIAR